MILQRREHLLAARPEDGFDFGRAGLEVELPCRQGCLPTVEGEFDRDHFGCE